ncbi:TRAP transporter small permease [Pollutimonas bauzanensis]|uniref:TRAP transporter small permease n=1 Tax=Pollutimonas bauzanensis TaxID=658167 RepID=UPI00333FFB92
MPADTHVAVLDKGMGQGLYTNRSRAKSLDITRLGLMSRLILAIATAMALTATCIMVVEGLSRFFLNVSYFWAEESVRYLMVWAIFLTLGIAGFRQYHIRTELLVQRLPEWLQKACWVLSSAAGMAFAAIVGYASIAQVQRYYTMNMLSESNLQMPMWIIFLAMPIGAMLLFVYYAWAAAYALCGVDPFMPSVSSAGDDVVLEAARGAQL